ncbi:hypothetical protein SEA_PERIWINKLE_19 [Gordonia phage Periwinkle]|nr:hypothetical protein SEA_PERIWINKLE_19 [Gordonia phage Periwinkle]
MSGSSRNIPIALLQVPQRKPRTHFPQVRYCTLFGGQHLWSWSTCSRSTRRWQISQPRSNAAAYRSGETPYLWNRTASGELLRQSRHHFVSARWMRLPSRFRVNEKWRPHIQHSAVRGLLPPWRESSCTHAFEQCFRRPDPFSTSLPHTTHTQSLAHRSGFSSPCVASWTRWESHTVPAPRAGRSQVGCSQMGRHVSEQ